jgi:hypothetical protein
MANTTNFNWETPDDTDLVKDGAAAIRTLGNSIDTSFVDLKGGTTGQVLAKASNTDLDFTWSTSSGIQATLLDAKGDLIAASAADTAARLAVGTNGQYLSADSTASTGLKWVTASTWNPDFQLINAGGTTLTGAATITVNVSGKNELFLYFNGASCTNSSNITVRLNTDTGSNYYWCYISATDSTTLGTNASFPTTSMRIGSTATDAGVLSGFVHISGTNATGVKPAHWTTFAETGTGRIATTGNGYYGGTSAITSISLFGSSGVNFDAGTLYVYGA